MGRSIAIFLPICVIILSNIFEKIIVTTSNVGGDALMGITQHAMNMTLKSPRHHIFVDLRVNNGFYKIWMMKESNFICDAYKDRHLQSYLLSGGGVNSTAQIPLRRQNLRDESRMQRREDQIVLNDASINGHCMQLQIHINDFPSNQPLARTWADIFQDGVAANLFANKTAAGEENAVGGFDGDDGSVKRIILRVNTSALLDSYSSSKGATHRLEGGADTNALYRRAVEDLGAAVDAFVTPRPWWTIVKEPYPTTNTHLKHDKASSQHIPPNLVVILQRYPYWEGNLRLITATQFPYDANLDACGAMSVSVGRQSCVHPGWHSVTDNYNMARGNRQFDIFSIFFPIYAAPIGQANNSFMSVSDCPNNPNQWTCAFLPMTNCTLPWLITDCRNRTCQQDNSYFSSLLFPANDRGNFVAREQLKPSEPVTSAAKALHSRQRAGDEFLYMLPYNRTAFIANTVENIMNSPDAIIFIFFFMIRKTYLYRQRTAALLHTIRSTTTTTAANTNNHGKFLSPTTPCIAAHVRRGDRVMYIEATHKPINMIEYCHNASLPRIAGQPPPQCITEHGTLHECPALAGLSDFGCGAGEIPFEAITLKYVIEKAELMAPPHVRSLVLASDDVEWLDEQILIAKRVVPHWKIYVLPDPTKTASSPAADRKLYGNAKNYHFVRSEAGTDSGAYFHASIELAQQCQGLVAHFGSGIPQMMYRAMCFHHAGTYGVCPPVYHLGKI